jgi:hypothetical protein
MLSNPQNLKIFQKFYRAPEPRITIKVSKVVFAAGAPPQTPYTLALSRSPRRPPTLESWLYRCMLLSFTLYSGRKAGKEHY